MKKLKELAALLAAIMVLTFIAGGITSFAATTPTKSNYPTRVNAVLRVWNENQVDGYACTYDNSKKIVMYYNTNYAYVDGLNSSNKTVRDFALSQIARWADVVDAAQWTLGKTAIATFALFDRNDNLIMYYTTATGWTNK